MAETAQLWFDLHLESHLAVFEAEPVDETSRIWVSEAQLLAGDAAFLRAAQHRILDSSGGTPQMAAKWLVGWYAGKVADAVGFVLATGRAGVLVDTRPLRWRTHPDGWADRVSVDGCTVLVGPEHSWAGDDGVEVVAGEAELITRTVDSLVRAVRPVVEAVHGIARVGARSLWAEVADGFGLSPVHHPGLPVDEVVVGRLRAALSAPGVPWRVSPTLRAVSAPWGPVYLGQKGGCCLAYQRSTAESTAERPLCTTCSLHDPAECADRQLSLLVREPLSPAGAGDHE